MAVSAFDRGGGGSGRASIRLGRGVTDAGGAGNAPGTVGGGGDFRADEFSESGFSMGAVAGFFGIIAATQAPQVVFDFLVSSSGAVIVFVYMTICVAQIALRRRRERSGGPQPAISMWLFPYLSYAAIAGMGAVLIAMAVTPRLQKDFYFSCITLVVAVAAYMITSRLRQPRVAPAAWRPAEHRDRQRRRTTPVGPSYRCCSSGRWRSRCSP